MDEKELVTLIAKDFYNVASALYEQEPDLITEEMDELRIEVFELDDRSNEVLDRTLSDIIPILDELKPNIDKVSNHPYYRASLNRLKELFEKGYDKASEIYAEKIAASKTLLGATSEEMQNAAELMAAFLGNM